MTISIIVYGRNDSYGYNMHKRAAISLNCLSEVLTDPQDEIIFVDYNTSDNLPTFIEAIADTLTNKAKNLIRVLRVRPDVHKKFKNLTHAQVNEALARNIGVRRSNPQNKWVLSTNTDVVFSILEKGKSLSDLAKEAKDSFYEVARFDVPEPMWESLDRKDPQKIISTFTSWGKSLHLNEVVYGNSTIIYDAPGDFQLMLRDDIFAIHGFDEEMILGWHVDSNLCKRMLMLRGKIDSMQDKIYSYHCNHTRVSGWQHTTARTTENCLKRFLEDVPNPYLENQKDSWGLAGEEIEEFKIGEDPTSKFVAQMQQVITEPLVAQFGESYFNAEGYGSIFYSTNHVAPYLLEQVSLLKKNSRIVYIGYNKMMFEKLEKFCELAEKNLSLRCHQYFPPYVREAPAVLSKYSLISKVGQFIDLKEINKNADLLIFDFGFEQPELAKRYFNNDLQRDLLNNLNLIVKNIASDVDSSVSKVISIGAHNTKYYKTVKKSFQPIQNPYNGRILVGHKSNAKKYLKEKFYSEYLVNNISALVAKRDGMFCVLTLPMYSWILAVNGILTYKAKSLGLMIRMRRGNKKLKGYYS